MRGWGRAVALVHKLVWSHALSCRRRILLMFFCVVELYRCRLSTFPVFLRIDLSWFDYSATLQESHKEDSIFVPKCCHHDFANRRLSFELLAWWILIVPTPLTIWSSSQDRNGRLKFYHVWLCETEEPLPHCHSTVEVLFTDDFLEFYVLICQHCWCPSVTNLIVV